MLDTVADPVLSRRVFAHQGGVARASSGFVVSTRTLTTVASLVVIGVTSALLITGRSAVLALAFPAMAVALGALLLFTDPGRYMACVLWLWMLSPFIRRVVDAQNGWNAQSPILLAPMLVSALCVVDLVRYAPRLRRMAALPFVLALVSLVGGVVSGLFVSPPLLVLYAGLSWSAPLLLGLYIAIHPERHDQFSRAIVRALIAGVVVLGLYGIAQFLAPAIWDRLWMVNSRMDSIGVPQPLRVRVFSTMNAPGPLGQFLSAALLILLAHRSPLKWPAISMGVASLLLSLARSAWLGFGVGFAMVILLAPRTRRTALGMTAVVAIVLLAIGSPPLPPSADTMRHTIATRLTSMSDLSMDVSFRARRYLIPAVLADIEERPLGRGLGSTLVGGGTRGSASSRLADQGLYLDNGVLESLLVLGWLGGVLFLSSAAGVVVMAFRVVRRRRTGFGYLAAAVALLTQVVSGTMFAGVGGGMFWMAAGMALTVGTVRVDGERMQGTSGGSA